MYTFSVNGKRFHGFSTLNELYKELGTDKMQIQFYVAPSIEDFEREIESLDNQLMSFRESMIIINALLAKNMKISAIKFVRKSTSWKLIECKEFIENNFI